jgi:hypothetical protein
MFCDIYFIYYQICEYEYQHNWPIDRRETEGFAITRVADKWRLGCIENQEQRIGTPTSTHAFPAQQLEHMVFMEFLVLACRQILLFLVYGPIMLIFTYLVVNNLYITKHRLKLM